MEKEFRTELESQINKIIGIPKDLENNIDTNKSIYLFITSRESNDFGLIKIHLNYLINSIFTTNKEEDISNSIFTTNKEEDISKGNAIPVIVCNINSMRSRKVSSFNTVDEKFGDIYSKGTSNRLIEIIEEKIKSFIIIDNLDDLSKYYLNTLKYNNIKSTLDSIYIESTLSSIFEKDTVYYNYFFLNNENNKDYFNLSIKYSK